ncbi:MAG: hypothetical protein M1825_000879 [Sarcosagium campestre]|nr:MAG: hypothetical protein M1825_000879 [Sarcosagium campestre]
MEPPRLKTPVAMAPLSNENTTDVQDSSQDSVLGQFSYAPATQTTVITTTTTTTTSFPPLVLKTPGHIDHLDPKQYPLASSPTPQVLKQLYFDLDGTPACFSERNDASHSSQESKHRRSPVSISEAAERAQIQRKKYSQFDGSGWTTRSQRDLHPGSTTSYSPDRKANASYVTPTRSGRMVCSQARRRRVKSLDSRQLENSVVDTPPMSHDRDNVTTATPPITDTDLQLVEPFQPLATDTESSFTESTRSEADHVMKPLPPALDIAAAQDASLPSPSLSPITAAWNLAHAGSSPETLTDGEEPDQSSRLQLVERDSPDQQRPPATLLDAIPSMLGSFEAMPGEMQTYLMYQFLRRCSKPTLRVVSEVVIPTLKCDFLSLLPLELSLAVTRHLDFRSLCRAAQVSRRWRSIVNSDEQAWKNVFDNDGYTLADGELQRSIKEGWGWQDPYGSEEYERDISCTPSVKSDNESPTRSGLKRKRRADAPVTPDTPQTERPKRKAAPKPLSRKRQRTREAVKCDETKVEANEAWMEQLSKLEGPYAAANAAALAVPNPTVGLPNLRNLHFYKSMYRRHHAIRNSWMQTDTQPRHIAFRAHTRHVVTCLQFDTDKILTGSDDTNINVYDTKTGALRARLEGHEGGVWALQYEGNVLVSGSTDRSVRVWDIERGICTQAFQGHTSTVRCLQILMPAEVGRTAEGTAIMYPKQPLIITGSRDSTLRVWRLPQAGDAEFFQTGPTANDSDCPYFVRALTGHQHSVRAIAAHGDTLVSGSYDFTVRVWKISTGETVHRLQGHTQKVYSVVLDHKRKRCISGSMDFLVKVWSLETGEALFKLEGHTSLVGLLDLSHDCLVSAAADSTLRIWDSETGRCKSTLSAHTAAITCFQHDGQKVISGSDQTLKMWDVKTGAFVRNLLEDLTGVWQVKFNERRCVAAVQRNNLTYIEVLDFGAARDGVPSEKCGRRIVVDFRGNELPEAGSS